MQPIIAMTGRRKPAAHLKGHSPAQLLLEIDVHFSDYTDRVVRAGGTPILIPRESNPTQVANLADGLLLPGGDDIDPRSYGTRLGRRSTPLDPGRDQHEIALSREFATRGKPVLGICRGAQVINVARGGTLVDLSGTAETIHNGLYPPHACAHEIQTVLGSRLRDILGERVEVNSYHHQVVAVLGSGVIASATSSDGVIEAIELPHTPVVGVQWHPERFREVDPVFGWLVSVATTRSGQASR